MWHLLPHNDIKPHEETTTCECLPTIEFIEDEIVVIHNSFDGREGVEQAEKILKNNSI